MRLIPDENPRRSAIVKPTAPASDSCAQSCCHAASETLTQLADSEQVAGGVKTAIRIMQMDCPVEETLLRKKLGNMAEVSALEFNLMQRVLLVTHQPLALERVLEAIRSLGFTPETGTSPAPVNAPAKPWWPLALGAVAAAAAEIADWMTLPQGVEAVLALVAIAACGLTTYKKGWIALRNLNLNINALMSIAVTGALLLGQWPEAAMVMVLFTIAELIEARSLDRARNAISSLMQLTPDTASVQQADGSWQSCAAASVKLDSLVRVKPGERIALDGEIVRGQTTIDQAPITGESLPVDKNVGDKVFAGTINQTGSVDYRVTANASNTTLARIIHAVEQAQGAKAPTQRFVDRFSRIYTPCVFLLALAVAIIPPLLGLSGWQPSLYKALVMLVIACPCALVISTPVTLVSGLTAAARRGILIKGGVYLEQGRKLRWLALDKTGTLTQGKPVQTDVISCTSLPQQQVVAIAGSLASQSDHPVSQAIARASTDTQRASLEAFTALPGRGIRGTLGEQTYYLGNLRLTRETSGCDAQTESKVRELESIGKTVVLLNDGTQVLALFAVADTVKTTSQQAIQQLHTLGVKTVMLSGDNPHTAQAIAAQVGIDQALGDQLPDDKRQAVENYAGEGVTGMVGDGINDAPALAAANIGFAMGAMGTDTALETADVALMDDDLRKIPQFVQLSKRTYAILMQNIALALGIKALFLALTFAGLGTLWMAVFADVGASLLVVANGLRLLRH